MRRIISLLAALLVAAPMVGLTPSPAGAEGTDPSWATCSAQTIQVTLSPTDPTLYPLAGRLCLRSDSLRGSKTVELMISGLTYDHNYFNSAYQPSTYSYVYAATSRGYSTFNIDRLGVGLSGKPPADKLTVQAHAWTIEQVVRKLRSGAIGGRAFTTVVGIGHSLGAGILQYLAGTVTDPVGVPDFLVFSGWLHVGNPTALTTLATTLYPAASDPAFASAGLPADYMTTMPNTRSTNFYYTSGADPAMITLDEQTKQTGSLTERSTLAAVRASTVTLGITVPVLLSVGQYDSLQCNESGGLSCASPAAVIARESASYGPRACLKAFVVQQTGHSVSLHYKARDSYNEAHTWLDDYTINKVGSRDANGCLPS